MSYRYIFFDLDGTLTESGPGIMNSVAYSLKKMGLKEQPEFVLRKFVGPPLAQSFMNYCGVPEEEIKRAISLYREYYEKYGLFENSVYPGIKDLLEELKKREKILAVATSKPEPLSVRILEHFGLADYFAVICGATMDEKRVAKDEVIRYTLKCLGIKAEEKKSVLMVGDREHDVFGAKKHHLDCLGVLYGYGSRQEFEAAGADYIAETVQEVLSYV